MKLINEKLDVDVETQFGLNKKYNTSAKKPLEKGRQCSSFLNTEQSFTRNKLLYLRVAYGTRYRFLSNPLRTMSNLANL